jgi:GAF domain-containing protein
MLQAPIPSNDAARLQELRSYGVLDSPDEQAFDDIGALVRDIAGTPIGIISLVDENRQWFKSCIGLDAKETPRNISFCGHTILQRTPLLINDALDDPRFCDNPLVTGEPGIRFYAGAPILLDNGTALGTVCVIDRKPRELSLMQRSALRLLRQTAAHLVELRRARQDLDAVSKLLPLCSWCRSVKTEKGNWVDLHKYVSQSMPVTHSMCPDCLQREMGAMGAQA